MWRDHYRRNLVVRERPREGRVSTRCSHSLGDTIITGNGRKPPMLRLDAVHEIRSPFSVKSFDKFSCPYEINGLHLP
jgi:hypothetical protein